MLRGAGEYLQASGSPYANAVSTGGAMIQGAAMGAGAGMMLGPQGAAVGALLGTAIAATNKLFETWTQKANEAREEISKALRVDLNRRQDISSSVSMLRSLAQERELGALAGMTEPELEVIIERAAAKAKQVESAIDASSFGSAQELETLMSQRAFAKQLHSAASSRMQQIEQARQAALDQARQAEELEEERREEERKRLAEARRMSKFRMRVSEHSSWGDLDALRALAIGF